LGVCVSRDREALARFGEIDNQVSAAVITCEGYEVEVLGAIKRVPDRLHENLTRDPKDELSRNRRQRERPVFRGLTRVLLEESQHSALAVENNILPGEMFIRHAFRRRTNRVLSLLVYIGRPFKSFRHSPIPPWLHLLTATRRVLEARRGHGLSQITAAPLP